MSEVYYEITVEGTMASGEMVANTFGYREPSHTAAFPTYDECVTVANLFWEVWEAVFVGTMVGDWAGQRIVVQGYGTSGFPMGFPAVEISIVGSNGTKSTTRDSNAQVAIVKKVLGEGAAIVSGVEPPKRGYWAVGPMNNAMVFESGMLNPSGDQWVGLLLWVNAANDSIIVEAAELLLPVSFRRPEPVEGVPTPNTVLSYAAVVAGQIRERGSFRRSRNNGR